jgi:hypothetical protein
MENGDTRPSASAETLDEELRKAGLRLMRSREQERTTAAHHLRLQLRLRLLAGEE